MAYTACVCQPIYAVSHAIAHCTRRDGLGSLHRACPSHAHYIQTYLHRNSSGPAAARSRLDRAEQIRNTCKRLTYLEDKLHPLAKAIKLGTSIFVFSLLVELQADCLNFCDGKKLH